MRPRIFKGTLVTSTDNLKAIKAKRLIVEVLYNFKNGVVKEKIIDIRKTIEQ